MTCIDSTAQSGVCEVSGVGIRMVGGWRVKGGGGGGKRDGDLNTIQGSWRWRGRGSEVKECARVGEQMAEVAASRNNTIR